jgi:hypothetical protein
VSRRVCLDFKPSSQIELLNYPVVMSCHNPSVTPLFTSVAPPPPCLQATPGDPASRADCVISVTLLPTTTSNGTKFKVWNWGGPKGVTGHTEPTRHHNLLGNAAL